MGYEDGLGSILSGRFSREIVGVGERAYPRMGPAALISGYRILCGMKTGDITQLRSTVPITCVGEICPEEPHPSNTMLILEHAKLRARKLLPKPGSLLLLYKQTEAIRNVVLSNGWEPMANPPEIWMPWDNKAFFRQRAKAEGLPVVDFELVDPGELGPSLARRMMNLWGLPLVFQIPDFPKGGGRATFFVREAKEVLRVKELVSVRIPVGYKGGPFMVSPLIPGPSLSIEGCVTPWGILTSPLQLQLVDLEEVLPPVGHGRFCGHQWGEVVGSDTSVVEVAKKIAISIGNVMAKEGYRGIFGLDFVWDPQSQELKLLECNPRYTGAFPTLTLLQKSAGKVPLELFHLLVWLNIKPCRIPTKALEEPSEDIGPAAQIILFHKGRRGEEVKGILDPGRYRWQHEEGKALRVGEIFPFPRPPYDPREFLIVDGPPYPGYILGAPEELQRLARIIVFRSVVKENRLDTVVKAIVKWAYETMGMGA